MAHRESEVAVMVKHLASGAPRARQATPGDGGDKGSVGMRPVGAWTVAQADAAGYPALAALASWARQPRGGYRVGR